MKIITSESVNIGHPDKTCDTIADAFLDEALRQDPNSQMAIECAIKNDKLFIYGEATTKAYIDYDEIAKSILKDIGYSCEFKIIKEISEQSPDINQAVEKDEICSNDQGIVYGYATNESKEFMPLPIEISHKLMMKYEQFRKRTKRFFADAKSQVTIEYDTRKTRRIKTVLLSVSHSDILTNEEIRSTILNNVVYPVIREYESLYDDIGEYNETVETSISDLRVRYGLAENNSSNSDSILCSFYLKRSQDASTYRNKIVLTFKIQGGQITSHAIYMGQTQT